MPLLRLGVALIATVTFAASQQPAAAADTEPMRLVQRAEQLLGKGEVEDAVLLLWRALGELTALPEDPVRGACRLTAEHLLAEHDPRDAARLQVHASIARQQLTLAQAYKGRKWYETALGRCDVARRYDRGEADKVHAAIAAARPKAKAEAAAAAAEPDGERADRWLQRAETQFVSGDWRMVDGLLQVTHPAGGHAEWITNAVHEDHEVVVEFRPVDPRHVHDATLMVGCEILPGTANFSGYRAQCSYSPEHDAYVLDVWAIRGMEFRSLGNAWMQSPPNADGFRRLSVQVNGKSLRIQLDAAKALEAEADAPVRGHVGLIHGIDGSQSCPVQFRGLRVDPLPSDMPSDEHLRERRLAALQSTIAGAVDRAKALLRDKQPEPAAQLLRQTLHDVSELPAGLLRENLGKAIAELLRSADPLAARRTKAAAQIAGELVTLADAYAAAGMVRAAHELVLDAARFDPDGTAARLAAAAEAVGAWNLAQATARAAELAPPEDDGTLLREWFATGRRLDTRLAEWQVEGPAARLPLPENGGFSVLMPKFGMKALTKAAVHVRLPTTNTSAGLSFDVAGPHDYAIAFLRRDRNGLLLAAYRYANAKWTLWKQARIRIDAWRLDGWLTLELELTSKSLIVRGPGAVLEVDRKLLHNGDPRVGFYGDNDGGAEAVIEIRALRLGD